MIRAALVCLALAFVCLVLSSQLPHPYWIRALDGVALAAAAAVLFGAAAGLARLRLRGWAASAPLPVVASGLALGLRGSLVAWLFPPDAVPRVDYLRVQLGAGAAVAALFALVSGAALLSRGGHPAALVLAGAAVTAALYVAGPALLRVGVPLDHRTFLGLAGLGVSAYAVVEARRRMAAKGGDA